VAGPFDGAARVDQARRAGGATQLLGVVGGAIEVQHHFAAFAQAIEVRRGLQLRRIVAGDCDLDGHQDMVRFSGRGEEGLYLTFSARSEHEQRRATRALNEDSMRMIFQRWSPLLHLIEARIREFFREPEVIFWVYGFPIILAVTLGWAFRGKLPEPPQVDVQETPDKARAEMLAKKMTAHEIKAEVLPGDECERRLSRGKTVLYLIPNAGEIEYVFDPANSESVRARFWVEAVLARNDDAVKTKDVEPTQPGGRYVHFLLPALIATNIMGGGLFGVGFVLVDMRVRKLFKRIMATPMRHSDFLLSLVIARLIFLIPEMVSLLIVGYLIFGMPVYGSFFTLAIVILSGAAAFSGIGLLIGCRTEKTETASGFVNLVMLPQYIMSGVFFSSKQFPDEAQWFIQALPLTQLVDAMREVMLEEKSLLGVSWRIAILLTYAVVTFALALKFFKWR
jgi:ABC-type multidrug transport system permease subunit